ncbi:hypothetical protein A1O7_02633 [Cladophialophora yegresii CBS 114405]|uniref:Uncharacterized protein n=1 Tax=Cladophialophora yegresii CBS 114405 TaxID=1182544 RepID=W9WB35_9EURO|nr:uncharacterized protein A1O7_02633 [Cladophialophora yegresii CBS 114405]EXJ62200.1 hypothetical protein A1O7_02633 [Cladophialophora yegresii CBS 114405]
MPSLFQLYHGAISASDASDCFLASALSLDLSQAPDINEEVWARFWTSHNRQNMPLIAEHGTVETDLQLSSPPLSPSRSSPQTVLYSSKDESKEDVADRQELDAETVAASTTAPPGKELEPELDEENSPTVPIETHFAGEPVYMSGAVSLQDKIADDPGVSANDNIDCDYRLVFDQMPYRVIRRNALYSLGMPADTDTLVDSLPPQFVTTNLGIQRAWEEWTGWTQNAELEGSDENPAADSAAMLVRAIICRGGMPPTYGQQVIYAEDIIPLEHLQPDGAGSCEWNGRTEVYDPAYWMALQMQGEIWNEMPEIPTFT